MLYEEVPVRSDQMALCFAPDALLLEQDRISIEQKPVLFEQQTILIVQGTILIEQNGILFDRFCLSLVVSLQWRLHPTLPTTGRVADSHSDRSIKLPSVPHVRSRLSGAHPSPTLV